MPGQQEDKPPLFKDDPEITLEHDQNLENQVFSGLGEKRREHR